ncbi:MAG: GH3 auxin-responsive promoter [Hyphomicrobium sp.]|nr:GH3 auxin-responsive promoter [Hyphomicrobium sp.]
MNGWAKIITAARQPADEFQLALRNPRQHQVQLLHSIVGRNRNTAFGRTHNFSGIGSLADFHGAVPIQTYEDVRGLIARSADNEPQLLTTDPIVVFEETGGTASGRKLIPHTAASLASFRSAILPWLLDLTQRRPGVMKGKSYVAISPATRRPATTRGGYSIGLASDAAYLGEDLGEAFASILAVPPDVAQLENVDVWRLATLVHLIECEDLSFVSIWSPTFFLDLIAAVPALASQIFPCLTQTARNRFDRALEGTTIQTAILWPKLDTISCWCDGSSRVFADRLAALCPHAVLEAKGLLATEAAITIPRGGNIGCVPALTSTVIEFIDRNGASHLADELNTGASYRVVITTTGGLYRYDIGDQVRCIAYDGTTPRLLFEGRASLTSDLVGEKLDEAFVAAALSCVSCPAVLVPECLPKPHYQVWLDGSGHCDGTLQTYANLIEKRLRANPQYAYARDLGQLGPLVFVEVPGLVATRNACHTQAGGRLADGKHTALMLPRDASREAT